jgi:phenylalanyl-tRNA synthetase alpha chain
VSSPARLENVRNLEREAKEEIRAAATLQQLVEARARYLGRKGSVAALLRSVGRAKPQERARLGKAANDLRDRVEEWVLERREALEGERSREALAMRREDVTLPGIPVARGHLHPVTQVTRDVVEFFRSLGFSLEEGPEVETEFHNFGALNFPPEHPARDMHDTFFVEGGHLLRTHTSPVQIRAMTGREPPLRFIALGRCYRHDWGPRSSPMFHQVEAFLVDERVTFGDLKGVLYAFARHLLRADVQLRFRASYFPFTEPSAELEYRCTLCGGKGCRTCSERGWIEWGGCGMIHPAVLRNCRIDPDRYQGFAFGMGLDRAAMMRHGIPSIHLLFEGDVRVLEQL